ncbi:FAD/NAD(P)-binding protein [Myxococcota bacterium]|nr:FAD/NAD(P)-binding protein [Myxococcota bacterium]
MFDWLVIGGGIHGTHVSLVLSKRIDRARVGVLDPHDAPLARWDACTRATGMTHLRSPAVHHLDLDPWSLKRFADGPGRALRSFSPPYERPGVELFRSHVDAVRAEHGLDAMRVQGRAERVTLCDDHVTVETNAGVLAARRVVLALGAGEQPEWPSWAAELRTKGPHGALQHIFEVGFDRDRVPDGARVVVIGGGISAAQVALALRTRCRVTLLSRHELRRHMFDSDPGWLGPKYLAAFAREVDPSRRRAAITEARHRGSMPENVHRHVRVAAAAGELRLERADIDRVDVGAEGLHVRLGDGRSLDVDRVLLATGFDRRRPGGVMVDALVDAHGLRCAACGYPIVDEALRWHPRLFVTGPLAELELGPVSRNIAGARAAGERIGRAA